MAIRSTLRRFFGGSKEQRDELKELGLTFFKDTKMENRIQAAEEFYIELDKLRNPMIDTTTSPEDKLGHIEVHATALNRMLKEISIPYGRAGDEPYYAMALSGWTQLHAQLMDSINSMRELMRQADKEAEEATELARRSGEKPSVPSYSSPEKQKLQNFLGIQDFVVKTYTRYAELIAGISWKEKDVAPSWSVTVMHPYVFGGGGMPWDASGGKVSRSDTKAGRSFPRLLDAGVAPETAEEDS